jgi:pilus assembly protein FimV
MTDSTDTTNELDSYGVWVKRPSKAPSAQKSDTASSAEKAGDFNLDADLPDFPDQEDTTLTTEELSNITDTIAETPSPSGKETSSEEVSLDDFLDSGFSEPKETDTKPAAEEPASSENEDVSLDDFLDSGFSSAEKQPEELPDEKPLDIDLSFSSDAPSAASDTAEEQPAADTATDLSESVDLSSFDEPAVTDASAPAAPASDTSPASDFDDMFGNISDEVSAPAAPAEELSAEDVPTESSSPAASDTSSAIQTEEVNLSDFGIDENAEEAPASSVNEETKPKEDTVDYSLSVGDENVSSAPSVNEIAGNSIPDSFEEETGSLIGSAAGSSEKAADTSISNTLLQQIVSDLSGLKNEISSLKSDFADLKARDAMPAPERKETKKSNGFFNEEDEDDTIALSGDELDNIMNTADFTNNVKPVEAVPAAEEKPAETEPSLDSYEEVEPAEPAVSSEPEVIPEAEPDSEPAAELTDTDLFGDISAATDVSDTSSADDATAPGLTMDFNETLEEPDLGSLSDTPSEETVPEELPEEISIPKVDDILVESSSTDFMDSVKDTTEEAEPAAAEETVSDAAPAPADFEEPAVSEEPEEIKAEETAPEEAPIAAEPAEPAVENTALYESEPSVADSLTEKNIQYLSTDKEEAAASGTAPAENTAPAASGTDIPSDLKQEVKSVLLYMDQLLENLPEDKIIEFARSEQFATYKKLFSDLGLS